jgi:hypothetical protein
MRPLSPFSITQEAPPLNRNRRERAHAAWHDPLPDPIAQDDSIDEGRPFTYERQSQVGPSNVREIFAPFADPKGFSYEQLRQPQSNAQAGSSTFSQGPSSGPGLTSFPASQGFPYEQLSEHGRGASNAPYADTPVPSQEGPPATPRADSSYARQIPASFPSTQGFHQFSQPHANPASSGEPPTPSAIPLPAVPSRERSMPDINGLRLSPTLPSVHIGIDQNAGHIVEPPTWRVGPLSPLAYFSNNDGDDDGGEEEEEEGGWGEGDGEDGDEDAHDSGEEGADEGEGDDIHSGRDGGRWASLACSFSDTLSAFSLTCGTRIAF